MESHETAESRAAPPFSERFSARRADGPLRVLHLAGSDLASGAGIQASRLHAGLLELGHASRLLVKSRNGHEAPHVEELRRTRAGRWLLFHAQRIERSSGFHLMLHPSSPGRPFAERLDATDVLQLHDVHSSFVNPAAAARWSRRLPVVWTLQDMWPVTGKCIYSYECDRWKTGCGACPHLGDWPALEKDRTDFLWRWKRRLWMDATFHLVCPSEWLAEIVRKSPLLGHRPVEVIPNSVDTRTFQPRDSAPLRAELGIGSAAVVVAFGSHASVPRKGFSHLLAATSERRSRGSIVVLAMGEPLASARDEPGVVWAGTVPAGEPMAKLLAVADILCLPTLAENLALVVLEAAATGIPAVAFDAGGTREAVRPGETGLLVPTGDTHALAGALHALADDPARRRTMGAAARTFAAESFDDRVIAGRYEALYRGVLAVR